MGAALCCCRQRGPALLPPAPSAPHPAASGAVWQLSPKSGITRLRLQTADLGPAPAHLDEPEAGWDSDGDGLPYPSVPQW